MKIAFFNYLPLEYGGGLSVFYRTITTRLHKRYPQHTYTIIVCDEAFSRKLSRLYSLYFRTPRHTLPIVEQTVSLKKSMPGVTYKKVANMKELTEYLRSQDIIYVKNDLLELIMLRCMPIDLRKKRLIIGYHTPILYDYTPSFQATLHNLLYGSFLYRWLIGKATFHHTLHKKAQAFIESRTKAPVITLYNAFPFASFRNEARKNRYVLTKQPGKLYVLWVGRLTEQKGVSDLLEIIRRVNLTPEGKKIVWILAGSGELSETVKSFANKTPNVRFEGHIPQNAIAGLYGQADLFISTGKWESLPYTFLEAISFSLPIITFKLQGISELIVTKRDGFIVSTIEEFVDTIRLIAGRKQPMKTTRSQKFLRQFHVHTVTKQFYTTFIQTHEELLQ